MNVLFSIFPWENLGERPVGFDMGCGSGRWAKLIAPKVHKLHCIDPSSALNVARRNLKDERACEFHAGTVSDYVLPERSTDFGYCLGVLHHVPDPAEGIKSCVRMLKTGAPLLIYLYYALDNRPIWYRSLWRLSNFVRLLISKMPYRSRFVVTQIFAGLVYFPMARLAYLLSKAGVNVSNFPLSFYMNASFYTMRTDALDRFGTRLEKRFTKVEIMKMMEDAGLENIVFSDEVPFWCAVGFRSG